MLQIDPVWLHDVPMGASNIISFSFGEIRTMSRVEFEIRTHRDLALRFAGTDIPDQQETAWTVGNSWLWDAITSCPEAPDEWLLLVEYAPPLLGARADALIVAGDTVVVIEMKTGDKNHANATARKQALGYAQDLWAYVLESRGRRIRAVVLTLRGHKSPEHIGLEPDERPTLDQVENLNVLGLSNLLSQEAGRPQTHNLISSVEDWTYAPRPTIVQAAVALVAATEDRAVITGLATDDELERLVSDLADRVRRSASRNEHLITFVTGAPGAGKTLVGLRLAHDPALQAALPPGTESPLYLTGNQPLVQVLTEVLARDENRRRGTPMSIARRTASSKVLLIHSLTSKQLAIQATVIIFDEGQRVWDEQQMTVKHGREARSEAEEILERLEQHPWSVIVVLVGTGQDINRGEMGPETWVKALESRLSAGASWHAVASPIIEAPLQLHDRWISDSGLNLSVVRRTDNSADVSGWANLILQGNIKSAFSLRMTFPDFPLLVTRDLEVAKEWLRKKSSGGRETIGLLASSRSARLATYGVHTPQGARGSFPWVQWFLERIPNLNSSEVLETAASEFKCQGLELDWTCVCWSWDLVPKSDGWIPRRIDNSRGSWRIEKAASRYALNAYRVLLTRSRRGMVIWVPEGNPDDPSRNCSEIDRVFGTLLDAGCSHLE